MILHNTIYPITDNSGAKLLKGIRIYKATSYYKIPLGKTLIGVVKNIKTKENLKLKQLHNGEKKTALLVRKKQSTIRIDGSYIKFNENSVVLIDLKKKPLATRILGFLPLDLRKIKIAKILLIAEGISL